VYLLGLLLGAVGVALFIPSGSAVGADGFTLREGSIVLMAIGLAMLLAGPVIRLPLKAWANYVTYAGQAVCFVAVVWFMMVFPGGGWDTATGNQSVILLYVAGLALIALGGIGGSLVGGATEAALASSKRRLDETESELDAVREERDQLEAERDRLAAERDALEDASDGERAATEASESAQSELEAQLASLRESQAQFELYGDRSGNYRWRLRHRNGNIIADSAQGYTRKHNAKKGLASVRRNALGASLLEIDPAPDEDPEQALEDAPLLPDAPAESAAEFELYEDNAGDYRWRLRHRNGNVIADSGEGYSSKAKAKQGIASVQRNAEPATYLRFDPASFEIYRDNAGEWRWRFVHKNGNILAAASEGYSRRRDAKRSIERIRDTVADADEDFEIYEDNRGEYRWRLRAGNNEIVATSGEGYTERSEAQNAVERVQTYAPDGDALDVGFAAFEVYEDAGEEWRWRLRHRNGNVLADSGEGYTERNKTHDAIESVKGNAVGADTTEH
jgi:uncharacterized protein YegP (UPF0339 family)